MTPPSIARLIRPASAGRTAFYRLRRVSAMEGSETVAKASAGSAGESRRVADARARADERLQRQRSTLRPLGWMTIIVVAAGTIGGRPAAGVHGTGLGLTVSLCVFVLTLLVAISERFPQRHDAVQLIVIATMGAAGVALSALQVRGATDLAAAVAVWMAVARLPLALGVAVGAGVTSALGVATGLAGASAAAVVAGSLLCGLLGFVAYFLKQARESQARTEMLLAQLEDAREEQTRAAAVAERGRIAAELHDVLAHSLSGAAIQLQGARMLADREHAQPQMRHAIDRASELVRDGLAQARQAVGALRGDELPTVGQLDSLIASFRDDLSMDVTLTVDGAARPLPADASLALYRGAQEALTNAARYAPGAATSVELRYGSDRTTLSVEDRRSDAPRGSEAPGGLADVGGGRGLAGMRERVESAGGSAHAGPTDAGWRVELEVPE